MPDKIKTAFNLLEDLYFNSANRASVMSELRRSAAEPDRNDDLRPDPAVNVIGIGIGQRYKNNVPVQDTPPHLHIYVRKKFAPREILDSHRLKSQVGSVPIDVIEVGIVTAGPTPAIPLVQGSSPTSGSGSNLVEPRPTECGVSVGHPGVTVGTSGAIVKDRNGRIYLLSNNHVIADSNAGKKGSDKILQPGCSDGGDPLNVAHHIATLTDFHPIDFSGKENFVDAAIASTTLNFVSPTIRSIGKVAGTVTPALNQLVQKHGRSTKATSGIVRGINAMLWVNYPRGGPALFKDQIVIDGQGVSFAAPGDSGSLVLDTQQRACGLFFAQSSSSGMGFANPIQKVLKHFKVAFA